MRLETVDRRRMLAAAVVTALLVPFLLRAGRASEPPAVASVQGQEVTEGLKETSPEIGYLNGPETTLEPAPILIGVPAARPDNEFDTKVGYRVVPPLWRNLPRPCIANDRVAPGVTIPNGTTLTITNQSNAHRATCVVVTHLPMPPEQSVQLTEAIFAELGDQIDAPLTVRISWKR